MTFDLAKNLLTTSHNRQLFSMKNNGGYVK